MRPATPITVNALYSTMNPAATADFTVSNLPSSQYMSDTTTQPALVSAHLAMERQRILARRANGRGPRIMVLGPPSSGKSTVVKSLVNMASSSGLGWSVGVASLDPASVSVKKYSPVSRIMLVLYPLTFDKYSTTMTKMCSPQISYPVPSPCPPPTSPSRHITSPILSARRPHPQRQVRSLQTWERWDGGMAI